MAKSFRKAKAMPKAPVLALSLPTAPKEPTTDFFAFSTLIYGRPGVGKTTLAASFPASLLLSCERVSKGIRAFDFNAEEGGVTDWDIFRKAVDLLEGSKDFRTIVIDTIEAAYVECFRWVCKKHGVEHPSEEAYGKSWDAIKSEFALQLDRIWATGRGIVFTAHAEEKKITAFSGAEFTRIQPAISGQALKYLKAKTDNVLYAEFVADREGKPLRILVTEGDELIEAKHAGDSMPRYCPLPKEGGAELLAQCFTGDAPGLKPGDFKIGKRTGEQAAKMVQADQHKAVRDSLAGGTAGPRRSFRKGV